MTTSKSLLLTGLVFHLSLHAVHANIDSMSPASYQVGVTADMTVKATSDSRAGTWEVKITAKPSGWTIDNGFIIPGDIIDLSLSANQQGTFVFKATPSASAVNGNVSFELWYDRGIFGGGWIKVDGPDTFSVTKWQDVTAPTAPGTPDLAASDDTGASSSDNITRNTASLTFSWAASTDSGGSGFAGYQWKLDSGSWNWVGNVLNVDINASESAHTFYVQAKDNANNYSQISSLAFTVDTTSPALPGALTPSGNQGSQRPALSWGSVTGAHHYHVKVWWDNLGAGYPVLWEGDVSGTSYTMTTDLVWERNYLWAVTAVDTAGNESPNGPPPLANNYTALVAHDTTGPTTPGTPDLATADDTGSSSSDNITKNSSGLTFSWASSSDSQSGLAGYEWKLDSSTRPGTWLGNVTSGDVSAGEGTHTLYVWSKDNAGNYCTTPASVSFTVDTTSPALPGGLTPSGNQGSQRPALSWGSVTGAHHYHVKVWWDNLGAGYPVLWEGDVSGTSYTMTTDLVWERNYLWAVTAVDTAGNESPNGPPPLANNYTALVAHDTTAPTAPGTPDLATADDTGSSSSDNITKNSSGLTFSWASSSDSQSGLAGYEWKLDSSTRPGTWLGNVTSGDVSAGEGTHTLYVWSTDNAGNYCTTPASVSFTVDTTSPALPGALTPSGNQGSQRPALSWGSVTGAHHYHVKVWWDNLGAGYPVLWEGDVSGTSYTMTTDLVWERNYLWAVTAVDTAGNESPNGPPPLANNYTALVAHDTTAPTAPGTPDLATADDTGSSTSDNVTSKNNHLGISWAASADSQSGVQKYQWRLDADSTWWDVGNGVTPSGDLTGGWLGWAAIPDGVHTVYVRAVDNANPANYSTPSSLAFTVDTQKPANPQGLTPSGNQGNLRPTLSWGSVTGVHHYHVKVWWDNLGAGYPVLWEGDVSGTSYTMTTDLVWERNYLWAVTAVDTAGNESPNGPPPLANNYTALVAHDTTAPTAPGTPDLATADDTGSSTSDNVTSKNNHLGISWAASTDSQSGMQKYQWRLDADSTWWDVGNGVTPSGDLTGGWLGWAAIPDGVHTVYVRAVDNANPANYSTPSSLAFTVDTQKPANPQGLTPSGNQGSQRPALSWGSVTGTHHYHVKVWWDNLGAGYPVLWEGDVSGTSYTMTTDLVWERNYLWAVTAVDTAGNESPNGPPPLANNYTALVAHDTTAPTTPGTPDLATADDTGSSTSDNVTSKNNHLGISWAASTDSQSGVQKYQWRLDADSTWWDVGNGVTPSGDLTGGWLGWAAIPDGVHTVYVRAVDNANPANYSTPSSLAFTVDTQKPANPQGLTPSGVVTNQRPLLQWSAVTGAHHYELSMWEGQLGNPLTGASLYNRRAVSATSFALDQDMVWERDYIWRVAAVDLAGNVSDDIVWPLPGGNYTAIKAHDTTVPTTPGTPDLATADDTGSSTSDNVTSKNNHLGISWAASTDSQSGVQKYQWRLDADSTWWDVGNGVTPSGDLTGGWLGWAAIPDGVHTVYVRAVDNANPANYSTPSSLAFTVDTQKPANPQGLTPSGVVTNQRPLLQWSAVAGAHHYELSMWEGQLGNPLTGASLYNRRAVSATSFALDQDMVWERDYIWRVAAVDLAGNVSDDIVWPLPGGNYTALKARDSTEYVTDTSFRPTTHGFRFPNFGGNTLITIPLVNMDIDSLGNCYAFSARSLDYFNYGMPIPQNGAMSEAQRDDLIARQFDLASELTFVGQQMMAGTLQLDTMADDFAWLKSQLQSNHPWPIFLKSDALLPAIHAVVAYKIIENYQNQPGKKAIFVYDSNVPLNNTVIAIYDPAARTFSLSSAGFTFNWFTTLRSYTRKPTFELLPHPFSLVSPTNGAQNTGTRPMFSWGTSTNATSYRLVVNEQALPLAVTRIDATVTTNIYLPNGGELLPNAGFQWNVVASNSYGTRTSATFGFGTGAAATEARIIGFEQTEDRRLRFEIAADYFMPLLGPWVPQTVWIEYRVNGNWWPGRIDITQNRRETPMGTFYYGELSSRDVFGNRFDVNDEIDFSIGLAPTPWFVSPLLGVLPPAGTIYLNSSHYKVHDIRMNLEVVDAGRGYVSVNDFTPINVSKTQMTVRDLTVENNRFCWMRLYATNMATGVPLRGGAGLLNPVDCLLSSPTWPQTVANLVWGSPEGPQYLRCMKVDIFELISLNTLLGNPTIFKKPTFTYLSDETLPPYGSIRIDADKGGDLGSTDLLAMNVVDTILDFVPLFDSQINKLLGFRDQKHTFIKWIGKTLLGLTKNRLTKPETLAQITQAQRNNDPKPLVDLMIGLADDVINDFLMDPKSGELVNALISQGLSEDDAKEAVKHAVAILTAGQAIGNTLGRWIQYFAMPAHDMVWLRAMPYDLGFNPEDVTYKDAAPLALSLGNYCITNEVSPTWLYSVGDSAVFEITIKNRSETETLRDVWVGMDIYAPSDPPGGLGCVYEYSNKVENTHTPMVDRDTGRRGSLHFTVVAINGDVTNLDYTANADVHLTRFLDLPPGGSAILRSHPYTFGATTNASGVHKYQSGRYMTHVAVWRNGYPGDTNGIPATTVYSSRAVPIYLNSNNAPPAPANSMATNHYNAIRVTWDPVERFDSARAPTNRDVVAVAVYRSSVASSVFSSTANVVCVRSALDPEQIFVDTNVVVGQTYYYGLRSANARGSLSVGSSISAGRVPAGLLLVTPTNLSTILAGSVTQEVGTVYVANNGFNPMNVNVAGPQTWLRFGGSAFQLTGGSVTSIHVSADSGLLSPGQNSGVINVTAPGADGSPVQVAVSAYKQIGPMLSTAPGERYSQESYGPGSRTVTGLLPIRNSGDQPLHWTASGNVIETGSPVAFDRQSGTLAIGASETVGYSFMINSASDGATYSAHMEVLGDQVNGVQSFDHYASIVATRVNFTIASDHGNPIPAGGAYSCIISSTVTAGVSSVADDDGSGTRYRCIGWEGTGSVSLSGSTNWISTVIAQDSSITWKWIQQYCVTPQAGTNGSITPASQEWTDVGVDRLFSAFPAEGYKVSQWFRNGSLVQVGGTNYTTTVAAPCSVAVTFESDPLAQGSLRVDILPPQAVSTGAQWCVDSNAWQSSGTTLSGIIIGQHTVAFREIVGWKAPTSVQVSVHQSQTMMATGTYSVATQQMLATTSAYGGAMPRVGTNWYAYNSQISAMVTNSPIMNGLTQYVCRGWTGTGSAPTNGEGTNIGPFTLSTNSTVAWLWTTNYWLDTITNGNGSVDTTDQWCRMGSNILITAAPDGFNRFAGWTGQTNGCLISSNRIAVVIDRPRSITANFVRQYSLSVSTATGRGTPPSGMNWYDTGSSVTAALTNSPQNEVTTQYVCRGWIGTGSVPISGATTNTGPFTITNNSSIVWLWRTNFWMDVTYIGAGTLSTGDCWLANGTNLQVTATPSNHWHFSQWSGQTNECSIASNKITVLMDEARAFAATFAVDQHKLIVATPYGQANPPLGTNWFDYASSNSAAMINSPVDDGGTQYVCRGWTGTGSAPATGTVTNTPRFVLTNDSSIVWKWGTNYWLHADIAGSGSVGGNDIWYSGGSNVTLTANAAPSGRFIGWSGDTNGCIINSNRLTVLMDRARVAITANFVRMYSVVVSSPYGQLSPSVGTNWFDLGASCSVTVSNPSVIVGGSNQYVCVGWVGAGSAPASGVGLNTGTFTVSNDSIVVWRWTTNYWLSVKTNGFGTVDIADQWCPSGTNVTIRADSTDYGRFICWDGQIGGDTITSNKITVEMNAGRSITAKFSSPPLKMRIRFAGYTKTTALTNFPLLVAFDPTKMTNGFAYGTCASAQGYDLRFRDESATKELNYEVENWDTNGISYVWVQVPVLTNNGSIWVYWGDAGMASSPANCTTNGSTWERGFRDVWHLAEASGNAMDSTSNRTVAFAGAGVSRVTGRIAGGASFNGANGSDFLIGSCFGISNSSLTLESWAYVDAGKHGAFLKIGDDKTGYAMGLGGNYFEDVGQNFRMMFEGVRWIQPAVTVGTGWHHFAMVVSAGGIPEGFIDGTSVGAFAGSGAKTPTGAVTRIGGYYNAADAFQRHFNGVLDEVRISSVPRSADWLWASRMTVASNSLLSHYEPVMLGGQDLYGIPDTWKIQYFGGTGRPYGNAMDDWDNDGMPNLAEWVAGCNPTNRLSLLSVTNLVASSSGIILRWPSVPNRVYGVDRATNLFQPTFDSVATNLPAAAPENVYTDKVIGIDKAFYRIKVDKP